jgi:hypothetical protein
LWDDEKRRLLSFREAQTELRALSAGDRILRANPRGSVVGGVLQ